MKTRALGITALAAAVLLAGCAKKEEAAPAAPAAEPAAAAPAAEAPAAAPAATEGSDAAQSGGDKVKPMDAGAAATDQTTAPAPAPEQK